MIKKIPFIFLLLIVIPCIGPAQSVDHNQTVYPLSPILSVTPKIYVLNESDLRKHQLPQNYMIVKNPLKNTITLWEFPNEFPAVQIQQSPAITSAPQSTKAVDEKQKSIGEQKSAPELAQMTKLLESLGFKSGKDFSIVDLHQLLPGMNINKK